MTEYWPGSNIPKSLFNGFTLGYKGVPHGFIPGQPARPTKTAKPRNGGFAKHAGTISGLGPKAHQTFTIVRKTGAKA